MGNYTKKSASKLWRVKRTRSNIFECVIPLYYIDFYQTNKGERA